VDRTKQMLDQT